MTRIAKRLTAVLLVLSVIFATGTTFGLAETDADVPSGEIIYDVNDPGYNEGKDHLTTEQFFKFIDNLNAMFKKVFGFNLFNGKTIKVEVEGAVGEVYDEWIKRSGGTLDIIKIVNSIPDFTAGSDKFVELFRLDVDTLAPLFKEKANEFYAQGKRVQGLFFEFSRMYLLGIDYMKLDTKQNLKNPDKYDLFLEIAYRNGQIDHIGTDFFYDNNTHELKRANDRGVAGFCIDADGYALYAIKNCWQRNLGFCISYDIIANMLVFDYDTRRVYLTYDGKDWLFQFWKGIYWIANGAELGIYNRPEQKIKTTAYPCVSDEDMMVMSLELYQGNRLIFAREPELHWWMIGFTVEEKVYDAEYLTSKGTIEFPNEEFADLFIEAARKQNIDADREGATVSWLWAQGC